MTRARSTQPLLRYAGTTAKADVGDCKTTSAEAKCAQWSKTEAVASAPLRWTV